MIVVNGVKVRIKVNGVDAFFKSRIVDYNSNEFMIEYPISIGTGKTGYFNRGDEFVVEFIGADNAVYQFNTFLIEKRKDGIPLLVLCTPAPLDFRRIQRREYVRVPDSLKVSLSTDDGFLMSTALNISAGGMALKFREESGIEIGKQVTCEFFLYGSLQTVGCSVKRIWRDREFENISLEFLDINDLTRREMTKYVFSKQVDLRKKGLI